jgi:hypothetical protein
MRGRKKDRPSCRENEKEVNIEEQDEYDTMKKEEDMMTKKEENVGRKEEDEWVTEKGEGRKRERKEYGRRR